jgi:type III pantothenate kinase
MAVNLVPESARAAAGRFNDPILALHAGNSRLKWGLADARGWMALGVVPNAEIGTLSLRDWQNMPRPGRAVGVNVIGEAARVRVEGQLARWRLQVEWLVAQERAAGVVNSHRPPAQLGADRWASLVAARARAVASELFPPPCVVVNAGTVVTIDALDAEGVFRGGIILPGLRLMLQAIGERTVSLKVPPGRVEAFPTTTPDALASGTMQAVCGAIEQMRVPLRRVDTGADTVVQCYLAGGAAYEIAPHLSGPVEVVDNLVLEGVLVLAATS